VNKLDEELNIAQIYVNELIGRYSGRMREKQFMASKFIEDEDKYKDFELILKELRILKEKIDKVAMLQGEY